MTDSSDAFRKLEEKLSKAVEVFKRGQAERRALQQEVEGLRADSKECAKRIDALERELQNLRREREDVRGRVERLLGQIDSLTKGEAD